MMQVERRTRRSTHHGEAIALQLDASRTTARCQAMVLLDEQGLCVAAAGDGVPHDEIAVHAAMVARRVDNFEGTLYSSERHWNVRIRRFSSDGARLYVCAVGGDAERGSAIQRSIGGLSRILAN